MNAVQLVFITSVLTVTAGAADFAIFPSSVERGRSLIVKITDAKCKLTGAQLPGQITGVTLTKLGEMSDGCGATWMIATTVEAAFGKLVFSIVVPKNKDKPSETELAGTVELEITAVLPEPIPPGLKPQVDISWKVLPYTAVADSYGRKVAAQYFAIAIGIGNNSSYAIQLSNIAFDLNDPKSNGKYTRAPSNNDPYHITRGTIERERETGARAIILNSLAAGAGIYASMGGFFVGAAGLRNAKGTYSVFLVRHDKPIHRRNIWVNPGQDYTSPHRYRYPRHAKQHAVGQ